MKSTILLLGLLTSCIAWSNTANNDGEKADSVTIYFSYQCAENERFYIYNADH